METKPLLYGLIGFFMGGLLVSVAATTFDKPTVDTSDMSMSQMTDSLKDKQGDEFDQAFIASMIEHHEGAVAMAELSAQNAKHNEIKQLSSEIIAAQEKEINMMKQWLKDWNYPSEQQSPGMEH